MTFSIWVEITAGGMWDREQQAETLCRAIELADGLVGHRRSRFAKPIIRCRVTSGQIGDGWTSLCYETKKRGSDERTETR